MIQEQDIRDAIKAAGVDVDPYKIPADKPFKDAGLDSLDMFNTFLELEKYVGREISDEEIESLQTIQAILDYINNEQ
jgi:acyl carrier protein